MVKSAAASALLKQWREEGRNQPLPIVTARQRAAIYCAMPPVALKRYRDCAVVGSSDILRLLPQGTQIDSHQTVWRIINAPTVGFEHLAGSRTDIRLVNHVMLDVWAGVDTATTEKLSGRGAHRLDPYSLSLCKNQTCFLTERQDVYLQRLAALKARHPDLTMRPMKRSPLERAQANPHLACNVAHRPTSFATGSCLTTAGVSQRPEHALSWVCRRPHRHRLLRRSARSPRPTGLPAVAPVAFLTSAHILVRRASARLWFHAALLQPAALQVRLASHELQILSHQL